MPQGHCVARLDPTPASELSRTSRFWYWVSRRLFGRVTTPLQIHSRVPRVLSAVMAVNGILETGHWSIGPDLMKMIHIRVATLVGCVF
jgi:alkylhydroperoxidase family enzyme